VATGQIDAYAELAMAHAVDVLHAAAAAGLVPKVPSPHTPDECTYKGMGECPVCGKRYYTSGLDTTRRSSFVDPKKFGPHQYDFDGDYHSSMCDHGCGCWVGSSDNGGPVDPTGPCPNNLIDNEEISQGETRCPTCLYEARNDAWCRTNREKGKCGSYNPGYWYRCSSCGMTKRYADYVGTERGCGNPNCYKAMDFLPDGDPEKGEDTLKEQGERRNGKLEPELDEEFHAKLDKRVDAWLVETFGPKKPPGPPSGAILIAKERKRLWDQGWLPASHTPEVKAFERVRKVMISYDYHKGREKTIEWLAKVGALIAVEIDRVSRHGEKALPAEKPEPPKREVEYTCPECEYEFSTVTNRPTSDLEKRWCPNCNELLEVVKVTPKVREPLGEASDQDAFLDAFKLKHYEELNAWLQKAQGHRTCRKCGRPGVLATVKNTPGGKDVYLIVCPTMRCGQRTTDYASPEEAWGRWDEVNQL